MSYPFYSFSRLTSSVLGPFRLSLTNAIFDGAATYHGIHFEVSHVVTDALVEVVLFIVELGDLLLRRHLVSQAWHGTLAALLYM